MLDFSKTKPNRKRKKNVSAYNWFDLRVSCVCVFTIVASRFNLSVGIHVKYVLCVSVLDRVFKVKRSRCVFLLRKLVSDYRNEVLVKKEKEGKERKKKKNCKKCTYVLLKKALRMYNLVAHRNIEVE